MKRIFIYDLDRTVIDSDHRIPYKANGDLDLDLYYQNKNMVSGDTLLPLIRTMRHQWARGHTIFICTSRVMDHRDYGYLADKCIFAHKILSRDMNDTSGDAELKRNLISKVLPDYDYNRSVPVIMYEDNESVLDMLPDLGIIGVNSLELNRRFQT